MLQSFIVFSFMALSLCALGSVASKKQRYNMAIGVKSNFWTWEITLSLLIFTFFIGVRFNYGADYLSYLRGYENLQKGVIGLFDFVEFGFAGITRILANANAHFAVFFGFWAFVKIFLIYYAVKDERYLLPFIGLLIVLGPHLESMCNGMRQWVAACIFLYSIKYIVNRKLIAYLLCIFVAYTMHSSAIILVLFYFLPVNKKIVSNLYLQVGILLVFVFLGLNPSWAHLLMYLETLIALLGYADEMSILYSNIGIGSDINFGYYNISLLVVSIITFILFDKIQNAYTDKKLTVLFNLFFIGMCWYFLFFDATGIIFRRINIYFMPIMLVLNAYLLVYIKDKIKMKKEYVFLFILVATLTLGNNFKDVIQSQKSDFGNRMLYNFFWDFSEEERRLKRNR